MILFISGLVLMTFLFSYIFYFAVNKTYIYITPEEFVDSKAKNITFTEDEIDGTTLKNTEKLIKIEKNIYLEENY
ncbi:MAG: hypothetical protein H6767_03690 [Candidatus Peribacteria bacterium]|nr:MAG: hypothetical protein H6767_03690 [Candidatus Peribacteria bacterium]